MSYMCIIFVNGQVQTETVSGHELAHIPILVTSDNGTPFEINITTFIDPTNQTIVEELVAGDCILTVGRVVYMQSTGILHLTASFISRFPTLDRIQTLPACPLHAVFDGVLASDITTFGNLKTFTLQV